MSTVTFCAYAFVKRLKATWFNEEQTEALTSAQKESIDNALVTKDDLCFELEPIKIEIVNWSPLPSPFHCFFYKYDYTLLQVQILSTLGHIGSVPFQVVVKVHLADSQDISNNQI